MNNMICYKLENYQSILSFDLFLLLFALCQSLCQKGRFPTKNMDKLEAAMENLFSRVLFLPFNIAIMTNCLLVAALYKKLSPTLQRNSIKKYTYINIYTIFTFMSYMQVHYEQLGIYAFMLSILCNIYAFITYQCHTQEVTLLLQSPTIANTPNIFNQVYYIFTCLYVFYIHLKILCCPQLHSRCYRLRCRRWKLRIMRFISWVLFHLISLPNTPVSFELQFPPLASWSFPPENCKCCLKPPLDAVIPLATSNCYRMNT